MGCDGADFDRFSADQAVACLLVAVDVAETGAEVALAEVGVG